MRARRTRQILLGVAFCVTFCGVAWSALTPFDVPPVEPTPQQNQSIALTQARNHCIQSLSSSIALQTDALIADALEMASERCELLFAPDPIATLTDSTDGKSDKT